MVKLLTPRSVPSNPGFRISASAFTPDGKHLYLGGGKNQGNPAQEKKWGRIVIYEVS